MRPSPKLHCLESAMSKRSPTKGHLSWASATHRCRPSCPRFPKTPACLYQDVKTRELLLEQWRPCLSPLSSQILRTLSLISASAGNGQPSITAFPSWGGGGASAASCQRAGQLQCHLRSQGLEQPDWTTDDKSNSSPLGSKRALLETQFSPVALLLPQHRKLPALFSPQSQSGPAALAHSSRGLL